MVKHNRNMYRLGERKHSRRRMYSWLAGLAVLLVTGAVVGIRMLHADTFIGNTPQPVIHTISYATPQVGTFEGLTFKIMLPSDFKVMPTTDTPVPTYTWHGTTKTDNDAWIDIYVDANMANFALNHVVSVQANGSMLNVTSEVSDTCTNFTGATVGAGQTSIQAKWQGLPFLCETGTYTRDVVGIVSADGLNTVNISGPLKGMHHYFFVFTDNSNSPNYQVFTDALKSFIAK